MRNLVLLDNCRCHVTGRLLVRIQRDQIYARICASAVEWIGFQKVLQNNICMGPVSAHRIYSGNSRTTALASSIQENGESGHRSRGPEKCTTRICDKLSHNLFLLLSKPKTRSELRCHLTVCHGHHFATTNIRELLDSAICPENLKADRATVIA